MVVVTVATVVLHGLIAVAALKQDRLGVLQPGKRVVLHGLIAVAALKLFETDTGILKGCTFSTASSPWPH